MYHFVVVNADEIDLISREPIFFKLIVESTVQKASHNFNQES